MLNQNLIWVNKTSFTQPPFIDVPVPTGKFLPDTCPQLAEGMDAHVHTVLSSLPVSDRKLEEVITATVEDLQLSIINQWQHFAMGNQESHEELRVLLDLSS
jgi:hypothetical protein